MQEPERKEDEAADTLLRGRNITDSAPHLIEPKAYAFDGWSMVPFEPEST
ncbi:hypothetical protein FHS95_000950 [Sphingomonas naasensis]|nr:hypothetical protein [Sphingomonas naasensis]